MQTSYTYIKSSDVLRVYDTIPTTELEEEEFGDTIFLRKDGVLMSICVCNASNKTVNDLKILQEFYPSLTDDRLSYIVERISAINYDVITTPNY
jgi:hypothetical protein